MPYDADFTDAHRRHWEDAELLHDHERWANADQMVTTHPLFRGFMENR